MSFVQGLKGIVIFKICHKDFCLNLHDIYSINRIYDPVIKSDKKKNLFNDGNPDFKVVKSHHLFNLPYQNPTDSTRLLLINEFYYGMIADKVKEIVTVTPDLISLIEEEKCEGTFIRTKVWLEGRELLVPDLIQINELVKEASEKETSHVKSEILYS